MKKIKNKISFAILGATFIIVLFVELISIYESRKIIAKESKSKLVFITQSMGQTFEDSFKNIENTSSFLEAIVLSTINIDKIKTQTDIDNYEATIIPTLLALAEKTKPLSFWIVFNPDVVKGGHTISFIDEKDDGKYVREKEYNVLDFNIQDSSMLWWSKAIENGENWTRPYYWPNWKRTLITYSRAIYQNGNLIAVVGSDFNYAQIKKKLSGDQHYKNGYMWLADKDLILVSHPFLNGKNMYELDHGSYAFMCDSIKNNPNITNILEYKYKGKPMLMAYYKMYNGWVIASSHSEREMYSSLNSLNVAIIIIVCIGLLLAIIVAYFVSHTISDPIVDLVDKFKQGALGNLEVRANIKTGDELEQLGIHFNLLMHQLHTTINQITATHNDLKLSKEKAEEANKLKSAFLSIIFHETRTPLNAIIGFSELLVQPDLTNDERVKYHQVINQNCNSFLTLINNIIDLSHLVANQLKLSISYFSVCEMMNELKYYYQSKLDYKQNQNVILNIHYTLADPLILLGDKLRVFQILGNLIDNAIKYTHEGLIEVGYTITNEYINFYIKDTGIGLAQENFDLIFESFRQVDHGDTRLYQGAGLGLAIVKHLILLMKGEIDLFSNINTGTTFTVKLPLEYSR